MDLGIAFWLDHQLVNFDGENYTVQKVEVGSGMGVSCSGDLADASFFVPNELPCIMKSGTVNSYNMKLYVRFKDDILVVLEQGSEQSLLHARLGQRYVFFSLSKWQVDLFSVFG